MTPTTPDQRKWGMAIHLAALTGLLLPLGLVLGPMLVWMLKKHDGAFFDAQGKNVLNFQLAILVAVFIFALLSLLIRPMISIAFMVGMAGLLFAVMGAIKTYRGEVFNYPFSLNIFK